jgi:hypothetical protein
MGIAKWEFFLEIVEDTLDFDLLDLESVFSGFESFNELSFQDREYRFNLVSLMIRFFVEIPDNSSSIIFGDSFTFSIF